MKQQRKVKQRKILLKEKEQEIVVHEQIHVALAEAIKGTVMKFPPEASQEDEDSAAKVSWLSRIAEEVKKQVEESQVR